MSQNMHVHPADVHGTSRLVIDAIVGITHVVEAMHVHIAFPTGRPRAAAPRVAHGITGFVYRSVRAITGGVGWALETAIAKLVPLLRANGSTAEREAALAVVNGVLGDHLEGTDNPLAISMRLRLAGRPLELDRSALAAAIDRPGPRLLVLVHGLCRNDLQWRRKEDDPAEELARDLGYTPLYLHYNSGRRISDNGRDLAVLLDRLVEQWPVPIESMAIVAHSMGGLVSRSACHHAAASLMGWPAYLRRLVFIATPHHGAPLERGGSWADLILGASPYTEPLARLGKIRSQGITDLRYGNLVDGDWAGRDRFEGGGDRRSMVPLPAGTTCYAMAGTISPPPATRGNEPVADRLAANRLVASRLMASRLMASRLVGDGLVPLDSALGRHREPRRDLGIPESRQWVGAGMGHLDLLTRPEVWERIRTWLGKNSGREVDLRRC